MMPMDWPNAAPAADHPVASPRTSAGGSRLSAVCADFFMDDTDRLTDEERALMGAMLRGLVDELVDELLIRLPALVAAQCEAQRDQVYGRLRQSGLINLASVVALLLCRADEQRLGGRSGRERDGFLSTLAGDSDGNVADAAMALTIARGRRRDRFGRLGIEFDDLAAEDAVTVVHSISACIGVALGDNNNQALADAARKLIADHDEGRRLEAAVVAVARALGAAGQLDDDMVERIVGVKDAALLSAALSRRAGINPDDGWAMFTSGEPMLLTRMAGCRRSTAATIIASFDPALDLGPPERAIDQFDRLDEAAADAARRWLRLDPAFRAARRVVEKQHG